ncbi:MAG: pilus assembly protein PilZ [Alphaproteobacteria bacterium HGW-Alphaproteobacteria-13]|nr:MAG: pilus assembly protein PilZ [Alphaproteobacteria bacterium HGW-Alphaproteobacteria-13]
MESREPLSMDEKVAALSRGADRDSLFMQARLTLSGETEPVTVRVRNLSAGGMLAETPQRAAEGASVDVELPNVGSVRGRVVWVGEGKFGIAFERPVNPQAVRRQLVQRVEVPPHIAVLDRKPAYRRR